MITPFRGAMPSGEPIEKWVSLVARGAAGAAQKVGQSKALQTAAGAQAIRTAPGMIAHGLGWGTGKEDAMRERTTAEHEEARARQQQKTQANVNTGGIHNAPQTPSTSSVMGVVGKGEPMDLAWALLKQKKPDPRLKAAGVSGYNKPKRTPNHPKKSHIVVARSGGKTKTIRFGQKGAKTVTESNPTGKRAKKQKSFKARHAKNIARGPMSAAYWANKVKW